MVRPHNSCFSRGRMEDRHEHVCVFPKHNAVKQTIHTLCFQQDNTCIPTFILWTPVFDPVFVSLVVLKPAKLKDQ